jgi:hypothetical protein
MDLGLKNKIAMVGGASKGLGYAVARALAAEGAAVLGALHSPRFRDLSTRAPFSADFPPRSFDRPYFRSHPIAILILVQDSFQPIAI